jgi:hypothetical protein
MMMSSPQPTTFPMPPLMMRPLMTPPPLMPPLMMPPLMTWPILVSSTLIALANTLNLLLPILLVPHSTFVTSNCPLAAVFLMLLLLLPSKTSSMLCLLVSVSRIRKMQCKGKNGHARSGHAYSCPVLALIHRIVHLLQNNAPHTAPLYLTFVCPSTSKRITAMLCNSATALYLELGIDPLCISAHSLCAGGAMALLCARVNTDLIRLVGCWRSDEMLRYLHLQAYLLMHTFVHCMASVGAFAVVPGQDLAPAAVPLLDLIPLP